jgi:hypothetical protein
MHLKFDDCTATRQQDLGASWTAGRVIPTYTFIPPSRYESRA